MQGKSESQLARCFSRSIRTEAANLLPSHHAPTPTCSLGSGISILRSSRPGRISAGSNTSGRFVAATSLTCAGRKGGGSRRGGYQRMSVRTCTGGWQALDSESFPTQQHPLVGKRYAGPACRRDPPCPASRSHPVAPAAPSAFAGPAQNMQQNARCLKVRRPHALQPGPAGKWPQHGASRHATCQSPPHDPRWCPR